MHKLGMFTEICYGSCHVDELEGNLFIRILQSLIIWHCGLTPSTQETSGNTNLALAVLWLSLGVYAKDWLHVWA